MKNKARLHSSHSRMANAIENNMRVTVKPYIYDVAQRRTSSRNDQQNLENQIIMSPCQGTVMPGRDSSHNEGRHFTLPMRLAN